MLEEKVTAIGGDEWMVTVIQIGSTAQGGNPRVAVARQALFGEAPLVENSEQTNARIARSFDVLERNCARAVQVSDESPVWLMLRNSVRQALSACPARTSQCSAAIVLAVTDLQEEGGHAQRPLLPIATQGVQLSVCGSSETVKPTGNATRTKAKARSRAGKAAKAEIGVIDPWSEVLDETVARIDFCPERTGSHRGSAGGETVATP